MLNFFYFLKCFKYIVYILGWGKIYKLNYYLDNDKNEKYKGGVYLCIW